MSAEAVERVREFYGLARRGDPRELLELVDPDAVWRGVRRSSEGGEAVAKALLWLGATHRFRPTELIDVGDRVVVRLSGRNMHRLGAPWWATRLYQVVSVRGGRIVEIDDYRRRDDAFAAAGLQR